MFQSLAHITFPAQTLIYTALNSRMCGDIYHDNESTMSDLAVSSAYPTHSQIFPSLPPSASKYRQGGCSSLSPIHHRPISLGAHDDTLRAETNQPFPSPHFGKNLPLHKAVFTCLLFYSVCNGISYLRADIRSMDLGDEL